MSHSTRFISTGGTVLALCAAFAGCSSRTDVAATGSTPPQYQHVFITTQEIWFNTSASATADDSSWVKKPLTSPVTIDLVTQSNGSLGEILTDLQLAPGSYSQIRLIPVDASAALTDSAKTLGARFNEEADYVDSTGTTQQLALELPNPDKGIGIQGSLTVPVGNVGAVAGALGGTGTTTPATASTSGFGTTASTTSATTDSTGTSTSSTTTTVSFAMSFDGSRDLTLFSYGTQAIPATGVLLSAHPAAYDLAAAGAISGTLALSATLSAAAATTNLSNRLNIEATAQIASADGTRHVVVARAPVQTDGTFTLYPLPSNSSTPTNYDVVIHGAGIATMIVKTIPVTVTPPTTGSAVTTTVVATATATTPVSIGTLTPRAATPFYVNLTPAAGSPLPGGAAVVFYQTLPASNELPYVIEEAAVDPINLNLVLAQPLSAAATIDSGTYTASGTTLTLTSATPTEGAGAYRVAAVAPLFADGAVSFNTTVAATTAAATVTTPATVTVPTLSVASGATAASITASVTQASGGTYDKGEVIVTHDGAIVGAAALDTALAGGGTVTVSGLPGGASGSAFGSALYYLSTRVWSSSDPAGTVKRQWFASPVDLRNGSATGVALTIN